MKCPKIVEALDRILYLIGILIDGLRKQLQTATPCENPAENFLEIIL